MLCGDKIKYNRSKKGWTQEELAYHANISVKSIQRAEKNIQVSIEVLKSIANALELDYTYLLDEKKHLAEITREFSNQAHSINNSKIFNNDDIVQRIVSKANVKITDKVLDLACGTGIITKVLAQKSDTVFAVDITEKMISITKEMCENEGYNHVKVIKGNAEKLNFDNSFFDLIITRLSIHHFRKPEIVIREMKRILNDNGKIIIADIYSSEIPEESELHNAIEQLRDPTHVKALSIKEFNELFETNGFTINSMDMLETTREYGEWLDITNSPERYEPLYIILKNLVECNKDAGIDLRKLNEKIYFNHKLVIYELKKDSSNI